MVKKTEVAEKASPKKVKKEKKPTDKQIIETI